MNYVTLLADTCSVQNELCDFVSRLVFSPESKLRQETQIGADATIGADVTIGLNKTRVTCSSISRFLM